MRGAWRKAGIPSPRVTQFDDIDFTRVGELRKKFAPLTKQKGVKLTLTPFVLKAVADTLKKHPIFNSSLDEVANEIILKEYIHLGIAVDTDQGLMVPVIRDVDKKSVARSCQGTGTARGARRATGKFPPTK